MQDLFGEDSDPETSSPSSSTTGKNAPPLFSYFTKRAKKGYSRQISESKHGKYYVELKIYETDEIKKIQPVNRWRHSIATIKTHLNEDADSWNHIKEFVLLTQNDFKNCPITLLGGYE